MTLAQAVAAAYDIVDTSFGTLTVDVAPEQWRTAMERARDDLGCTFFDFLSAVDEGVDRAGEHRGVRIVAHVARLAPGGVEHLVLRTLVTDRVASVADVYAGAAWHERETAEMFGIVFTDGGADLVLEGLLLPDGFTGHPLRKDFLLESRLNRTWPGAKEPGESDSTASPSRRRARPPGVPEGWTPP